MNIPRIVLFASALGAVQPLRYGTSCALVAPGLADGYVTNLSRDAYSVSGQVRFVFAAANSISRPEIVATADAAVPAGQTVRVARVKLAFDPLPGETCRFEVKDAVRKD